MFILVKVLKYDISMVGEYKYLISKYITENNQIINILDSTMLQITYTTHIENKLGKI